MKSIKPVDLEAMTENADSAKYTAKKKHYGFGMFRLTAYVAALVVAALAAMGCNDSGGGNDNDPVYPSAEIMLNPSSGAKPFSGGVECDASGSIAGDWPIVEARFDFDNDGIDDYIENESSAPDGTFDKKTIMPANYPNEGDYPIGVTIMDSAGNESSATANFGNGFGADVMGAEDYIYDSFDNLSDYQASYGVPFHALDPVTGKIVDFVANVEGIYDFGLDTQESTFVIYDSSTLTQEQIDCLANREAVSFPDEPRIRVVEPDYSPFTIDDTIFN
jgi:hypothetical protein